MARQIQAMADDIQKQILEMWRELKAGQDKILERIHDFEGSTLEKINKNHSRIDRLETYASQGKWVIGLFSIPVVGAVVQFFFELFHPAK